MSDPPSPPLLQQTGAGQRRPVVDRPPGLIVTGNGHRSYSVLDSSGAKTFGLRPSPTLPSKSSGWLPRHVHGVHRAVPDRWSPYGAGPARSRYPGRRQGFVAAVRDPDGQILVSSLTNGSVELFPGAYTVTLHDVSEPASVRAGRAHRGDSRQRRRAGTGSTLYSVLDSADAGHLPLRSQIERFEMLPGRYLISVNQSVRNVPVTGRHETVVDR